jgi:hypothetical protein
MDGISEVFAPAAEAATTAEARAATAAAKAAPGRLGIWPPRGHQCLPQRLDFRRTLRMALVELFTKAFHGLGYVLVALRKQLWLREPEQSEHKRPNSKDDPDYCPDGLHRACRTIDQQN